MSDKGTYSSANIFIDGIYACLHLNHVVARINNLLTGIKCFEYNADSAACLMEAAAIQGKWAKAIGVGNVGLDAGRELEGRLVAAWKSIGLPEGTLPFF